MRKFLSLLCAFTVLQASSWASDQADCRAKETSGEACAMIRGYLAIGANSRGMLFLDASEEIIDIYERLLPQGLFNTVARGTVAFGDFTICFYDVPGIIRQGCVANAANLVFVSDEEFYKLKKLR